MRILDAYIGRVITSTTFITLLVLLSVGSIIKFVEQMRAVGRGNYDLAHAALYVLYSVPRDIEIFFPMAALVGGLIGLGMMASNSELVVMQAAGLSRLQIIKSVMKTAAVLILIGMAVGEWAAPQGEAAAREIRAQAISGGSLISAKNGIWAKDGESIVHIGEVEDTGRLNRVEIYRFDDDLHLTQWIKADEAVYISDHWQLREVENTWIKEDEINFDSARIQNWQSSLSPDKLGVVTVKPESLSLRGLFDYLDYLDANSQDPSRYQLAFWRKIMQPITVAVMLLVALSFIFGPLRQVSMGARIMMGILTGLLFDLSNQAFGSLALVYQLPPILGALMPSFIFIGASVYLLNRKS